jgi:sugar phosphate isomerase/epimerase
LLQSAALGAAGGAVLWGREAVSAREPAPYGPFKMGLQTYTLRAFPQAEALAKTRALGLTYWEGWDRHLPVTDDPAQLSDYRAKLKSAGVKVLTYGVVSFGGDREANRRLFQFARSLGIRTLSADPSLDAFPSLEELVREYGINVAIHNHGPGARYDKIRDVADALQGRHPRIGACVDTGHYLRSGEDPVAAVQQFGRRIYGLHLKDVKQGQFTELGKGDLQLPRLLATLEELRYDGVLALEYEEHERDPIPYVDECLTATRTAIKQLASQREERRRAIPKATY